MPETAEARNLTAVPARGTSEDPLGSDKFLRAARGERRARVRSGLPPTVPTAVLVALLAVAVLAPVIAPHDPLEQDLLRQFLPPVWSGAGETGFWLGTDELGRDVLSNILFGLRVSLSVGVLAPLISAVIGVPLGLLSGYRRGWVDALLMRAADVQLALPTVLVALAALAIVGRSLVNVILVIGLMGWAPYARLARAGTLVEREIDYVVAAISLGASTGRILRVHVLPNVLSPILVQFSVDFPRAVLLEATLSFLGLGVPVTTPSLGTMVSRGYQYLFSGIWWTSVFPGLTLTALVLAGNLLADWVRDRLDPRMRRWW